MEPLKVFTEEEAAKIAEIPCLGVSGIIMQPMGPGLIKLVFTEGKNVRAAICLSPDVLLLNMTPLLEKVKSMRAEMAAVDPMELLEAKFQ